MGKTEFNPFKPEQQAFCSSKKRYLGYVSGVGAGKTFGGILRTILNMERWNPGEMGAIVAPSRQMIINVIIPQMRDMGLFDTHDYQYNSAHSDEPGIHAPNGSRALMLSADNSRTIERLRGLNLAWAWMDEEAVIDPRAREILQQRLRTGNYRNLYITTTPKGKNHTYDFFVGDVDAEKEQLGAGVKYYTDDRMAIVGVPTGRNPHTPEDYKDAMLTDMPEDIAAQEVQGEFVEIGAGILTLDMLEFEPAEALEGKKWEWHVAVDLGVEMNKSKARENDTDYWSCSIVAEHPTMPWAYLVEVNRTRGQTPAQAAQWVSQSIAGYPTNRVRYESVQAQSWFEENLKDAGLDPIAVSPQGAKEDRIMMLSIPFSNGNVKLIDWSDVPGKDMDWQPFRSEWLGFPDGSHDDMLDSTAMALDAVNFQGEIPALSGDMYGDRGSLNE